MHSQRGWWLQKSRLSTVEDRSRRDKPPAPSPHTRAPASPSPRRRPGPSVCPSQSNATHRNPCGNDATPETPRRDRPLHRRGPTPRSGGEGICGSYDLIWGTTSPSRTPGAPDRVDSSISWPAPRRVRPDHIGLTAFNINSRRASISCLNLHLQTCPIADVFSAHVRANMARIDMTWRFQPQTQSAQRCSACARTVLTASSCRSGG